MTTTSSLTQRRVPPEAVATAFAAVVALAGPLVLLGWWLDLVVLKRVFPGLPAMAPTTALGLTLAGIALALLRKEPANRFRRYLARACAGGAILIGLLALAEHLPGVPLAHTGRPGFLAAMTLVLVGLALGLLDVRLWTGPQPAQLLAVLATLVALLALLGYACNVPAFYGVISYFRYTGMALHTALLVVLLGAGILCSRPDSGLMAILLSPGAGGVVARRLLLAPVIVPLVLGWLRIAGQRAGLYNPALGNWLFAFANITVFTLVIWYSASILYRADAERRQAEEDRLRLNLDLATANKELEAFCYSVSHDLRAPLRAVDGFSRILQEDHAASLPEEVGEYLRDIRCNAQRMGRLIDDLLAFSRLSRQPLRKQPVSVTALVQRCLEDLRQEREGRTVELALGELPACNADPSLLEQVWLNLLSNALKYTRRRDRAVVEIGCRTAEGGMPAYFVRDNGTGFDMAYAGKLFGVFQRLHRAEDFDGTGVGLAVVQRIVHRHGGRVWAEAEPDKGAVFFFTLGGPSHA